MTQQDAITFIRENWWRNNLTLQHENFDIFIGGVRQTEADDKYFPNSFLIETAIVEKGQKPEQEDWGEMFVSKAGDRFGHAIIIN